MAGGKRKNNDVKEKIPKLSHVSVHVHEGQIVPVVWDVGPAFCGYCGILSASFQAVYKHMQLKHSDEMVNHRVNVGMGRKRLRKWDGSTFLVERLLLDGNTPAICQPADSSPVSQDGRAALASNARSGKEGTTADKERLLLGNTPAICQPADSSPVSQDGRAALASNARSGKEGTTADKERLLLGNTPAICQPADSSPVSQDGRAALASNARSGKEGTTADNEVETCFPGTGPPASKKMKTWIGDENDAGGDNRHPRPEFRDAQKQGVIDSACFI
jgi:hypothetical protein